MDEYVRCIDDTFCTNKLGYASTCAKYMSNPESGFLNYDHFFYAFILVIIYIKRFFKLVL